MRICERGMERCSGAMEVSTKASGVEGCQMAKVLIWLTK